MVHPSQTLWSQWSYYPSWLTGDPHVEAVRDESVYEGYPDCIYLLFTSALKDGRVIIYDFPGQVLKPLKVRVFARTGPAFPYQGEFAYRLVVRTVSASDESLEEWILDEGLHFPHYNAGNPLPSSPSEIPIVTLMPTQPWKRLMLVGLIVNWNYPPNIDVSVPPEITVNHPMWSELSVSYIETEHDETGSPSPMVRLRLRPLTGASV